MAKDNLSEAARIKEQTKKLPFKDRFNLFMDYNLMKVIIAVAVILFIVFGVSQCRKAIKPDIAILYLGEQYFPAEAEKTLEEALYKDVKDINADGLTYADLVLVSIPDTDITDQYYMALIQKRNIELTAGESDIVIISKKQFDEFFSLYENPDEGFFAELSDITGKPGYTIPFSETKFSQMEYFSMLPADDYYICMRFVPQNLSVSAKKAFDARRAESVRFLKTLLIENPPA